MSDAAPVGRPMKFPYTFTAKIAQFPYALHWNHNWMYRYYIYAILITTPIMYKFHKMANTPDNKAKYAEMRRREAAEHHH